MYENGRIRRTAKTYLGYVVKDKDIPGNNTGAVPTKPNPAIRTFVIAGFPRNLQYS